MSEDMDKLGEDIARALTNATGVQHIVFRGYPHCPICDNLLRVVQCEGRRLLQCRDFYCDFETDVTPDWEQQP